MRPIGGGPIAVHGRDPNERRVAHGRSGEVTQRIVVRALPLHAAESEALGGEAVLERVGPRAPGAAQLLVLVEVEPHGYIGGIKLEGGQTERGEVRRLVDLDQGSCRLVHEVDREQQVLARGVQDRDVAFEPSVDRAELLDRRRHRLDECRIAPELRDALEPDVALLAQPVERRAPEHDPVLGRSLRESRLSVAGRHRRDPRPIAAAESLQRATDG